MFQLSFLKTPGSRNPDISDGSEIRQQISSALFGDLQAILNEVGNASKWETEITEYWKTKRSASDTITGPRRNQVFISYSRAESDWLARLKLHLKPFERGSSIQVWDDTRISTGADWRSEISTALESAKVAVLLVSPSFLASEFIAQEEIPQLLEAARNDGATIMPIILKPCSFDRMTDISRFQSVNRPEQTLVEMPEGEEERFPLRLTEDILDCLA